MIVRVRCLNATCGKTSDIPQESGGGNLHCPHCGRRVTVSAPVDPAPTVEPPARQTVAAGERPPSPAHGSPPAAAGLPTHIGRFRVRCRLGSGAFGTVYRAFDPQLQREVAVKVPRDGTLANPKALQRFLDEAKAAERLRHTHIVPFHEVGQDGSRPFLVSAFIEGQTLSRAIDAGSLDFRQAARIVAELALALEHAHRQGIMHRDVKPANVLLDGQGRAYLTDFGLAYLQETRVLRTRLGSVLGTPAYVAPEQAEGWTGQALAASDQYALGVVLYELLCGQTPFGGPPMIVLYNAVHTAVPPPRSVRPEVPAELERICLRALAKKPEQRFPSCRHLAEELRNWLTEQSIQTQPAAPVAEQTAAVWDFGNGSARGGLAPSPRRGRGRGLAWVGGGAVRWIVLGLFLLLLLGGGSAAAVFVLRPDLFGIQPVVVSNDPNHPVKDGQAKREEELAKRQTEFQTHLDAGQKALKDDRPEEAVKEAKAALLLQQEAGGAAISRRLRDLQAARRASFDRLVTQGKAALEDKKYDEAIKAFNEALNLSDDKEAQTLLKQAQDEQKKLADYTRQIDLGKGALNTEKWDEAITAYNAALKLVPNDPEATKGLQAANDGKKKADPADGPNETLKGHAQVARYWGAVIDQKTKTVLVTLPAQIAVYSYPDFKVQTGYKLSGNAYRPVVDRDQGLLYALVANTKVKAPAHVKRGGSNEIQVFDVKPILEGKPKAGSAVKPARTIPLDGFATHMFLSADGNWLYCLDVGDEQNIKVVKIDAAKGKVLAEAALKEGTDVLCASRDGKSLFSMWHAGLHNPTRAGPYEGGVQWVETDGMKVKRALALAVDAYELDATDDGVVFISGGGKTSEITVVDLKQEKDPLLTTWKNLPSGLTVRLSDDFKHLYTSSLKGLWIATAPVPDKLAESDMPISSSVRIPRLPAGVIRGEMTVTPDGQYLMSETGYVFLLEKSRNLLVNGSFEEGPDIPKVGDAFIQLENGSTALTGWVVSQGNINVVDSSFYRAADGKRSLDLNGSMPGAIRQTFNTKKGQKYRVTFALAGNTDAEPKEKKFQISTGGKTAAFTFDTTGKTRNDMGWVSKSWEFTAAADKTTLEFLSLTEGHAGPALDDVVVVAIRE
jgi:choice-of-anchor C domain-containing protein